MFTYANAFLIQKLIKWYLCNRYLKIEEKGEDFPLISAKEEESRDNNIHKQLINKQNDVRVT